MLFLSFFVFIYWVWNSPQIYGTQIMAVKIHELNSAV